MWVLVILLIVAIVVLAASLISHSKELAEKQETIQSLYNQKRAVTCAFRGVYFLQKEIAEAEAVINQPDVREGRKPALAEAIATLNSVNTSIANGITQGYSNCIEVGKESDFYQWKLNPMAQPAHEALAKLQEARRLATDDANKAAEIRDLLAKLEPVLSTDELAYPRQAFAHHDYEVAVDQLRKLHRKAFFISAFSRNGASG